MLYNHYPTNVFNYITHMRRFNLQKLKFIAFISLLFLFGSCGNKTETENNVTNTTNIQAVQNTTTLNTTILNTTILNTTSANTNINTTMANTTTTNTTADIAVTNTTTENSERKAEYHKISPKEAKDMMDSSKDFVILDVRTQEEFDEQRIDGAYLLPDTEIKNRAEKELTDKNQLIFIYCRSGRRSAASANELVNLGYTNVYDFGGIIDWPYATMKN